MNYIKQLKLINFKKFKEFDISFSPEVNTIVGDNEAGKSSILQAIELVCSGSRNKVEAIGFESIINKDCVKDFFASGAELQNLPEVHVEIYLSDDTNPDLVGKNHTLNSNKSLSGLHMICQPNEDLTAEIKQTLSVGVENFPYEFYIVKFMTFSGEVYSGYRNFLRALTIDNSKINSEYANKEYIKAVYESAVDHPARALLKNEYRIQKDSFKTVNLKVVNSQLGDYDFAVKTGAKYNLETDITLTLDEIPIDERGKGLQCFIKTEFALGRNAEKRNIDTLLLEEPENHLSQTNMKRLISKISESHQSQIIIATHSSLISSRLDLRKSILINSSGEKPLTLNELTASTARFFMKAPDNNILEFVLSKKVILVEGDAEYILIAEMYFNAIGQKLEADNIHVISVGGTSFKRYMELAKILKIKTAVIRDNDKDYQNNCVENYVDYVSDDIAVFSDVDNTRYTFEVCVHQDNQKVCDELFSGGGITKAPLDFMIDNKAEGALRLLDKHSADLIAPDYLREAFAWIRK